MSSCFNRRKTVNRLQELTNRYLLLIHVNDEVLLAFEFPRELGGNDIFDGALLALDLLVRLHFYLFRNYRKARRLFYQLKTFCPQPCETVRDGVSLLGLFGQKNGDGV